MSEPLKSISLQEASAYQRIQELCLAIILVRAIALGFFVFTSGPNFYIDGFLNFKQKKTNRSLPLARVT